MLEIVDTILLTLGEMWFPSATNYDAFTCVHVVS